jgi:hypothetical protein
MSFQATSSLGIVADAQGRHPESLEEIAIYLGYDALIRHLTGRDPFASEESMCPVSRG